MKSKTLTIVLLAAILTAACAPAPAVDDASVVVEEESADAADTTDAVEDDSAMSDEVSFSSDIWPVLLKFAPHADGGKAGVFFESYEELMDYVVPGDPEGSLLYQTLTATGGAPLMPPDGALPDETIQLFYDWIAQGALNN